MDLLKDLLKFQHEDTLQQVADKVLHDTIDKDQFIQMYNKRNYCQVKVCSCYMKGVRVKNEDLLSKLTM
jgi:hypothetical protein